MPCIFCKEIALGSPSAHIWPDSLGEENFLLPPGFECRRCNNYLGSHVEGPALGTFPFHYVRYVYGLKNSSGNIPRLRLEGYEILYHPIHKRAIFQPKTAAARRRDKGAIAYKIAFAHEPADPLSVCRFLLKIGLELYALIDGAEVLHERFDAARTFVRTPKLGSSWYYLSHISPDFRKKVDSLVGKTVDNMWGFGIAVSHWDSNEHFVALTGPGVELRAPLTENVEFRHTHKDTKRYDVKISKKKKRIQTYDRLFVEH